MIVHDVVQGSAAWHALRIGVPTASCFDKIVTPGGKLSEQADKYMDFLLAEKLLNRSLEPSGETEWMEWGRANEPMAAKMYEFENEVATRVVGFVTTDDGRIGASPDRLLVGVNGAVEIKCPSPQVHVGYMRSGFGKKYRVQVQGQMLVGEFEFVDRYAHHPEMPPFRDRTYRDEPFIALLRAALDEFTDGLAEAHERIASAGFFRERRQILTPHEEAYAANLGASRLTAWKAAAAAAQTGDPT